MKCIRRLENSLPPTITLQEPNICLNQFVSQLSEISFHGTVVLQNGIDHINHVGIQLQTQDVIDTYCDVNLMITLEIVYYNISHFVNVVH